MIGFYIQIVTEEQQKEKNRTAPVWSGDKPGGEGVFFLLSLSLFIYLSCLIFNIYYVLIFLFIDILIPCE